MNLSIVSIMLKKFPNLKQSSHMDVDSIVFDSWECQEHPENPTIQEMELWKSEFDIDEDQKKSEKKNKKLAVLSKLKITEEEFYDLMNGGE